MGMFQSKKKGDGKTPDGKSFLVAAKGEHAELFARFVANADEYDSVDEYTDALEAQAWELCEQLAKQSYKNGIARGRRPRRDGER